MNSERVFLFKLVVVQFYKQNTGLFLFFFLIFFGIIPPQFLIATHAALIQAQLTSVALMIGVSFFWALYAFRCLRFMDQTFSHYQHAFLNIYQVLPTTRVYGLIAGCFIAMFLPVLIYAIIVIMMAIVQSVFWYIISTSLLIIAITFCTVVLAKSAFLTSREISSRFLTLPGFSGADIKRSISLKFILLAHLWSDKKLGLLAQKLFSYLAFNFFFIRNAEIFREDYFTFFIFLIGAMNALLIFNLHKMTEEKLGFLRNLPLTMPRRIVMILLTGTVLFVPELIMMLISGFELLAIQDSLILYGVLVSQFVLLFSILYTSTLNLKKYVQYVFLLLLSYLVLYLLIPAVLIILFNLGLAYLIFHEQYHAHEFKA
ncbi:MAG: hypothetical protein R8G66_24285 [Cytophagales bacterium]|nr:hypothetical protein [Cytophagales bacterium]